MITKIVVRSADPDGGDTFLSIEADNKDLDGHCYYIVRQLTSGRFEAVEDLAHPSSPGAMHVLGIYVSRKNAVAAVMRDLCAYRMI